MRIVIVGGSAAGLSAGLMLARAGHQVVVLERDGVQPALDVEAAAASAFRPAAPQLVQPHVVLALCRELLRERLPDVYVGLLDAGVVEAPLVSQLPPTITDRAEQPGDERMPLLMTRRSTVDWVLRRRAALEPGMDTRGGVRVIGLLAEPGRPPRVVGVRTDRGEVRADLVVDASGRRSQIDRWLSDIGARPSVTAFAECGLAYYSRQYRLRRATGLPGPTASRVVAALDEFGLGIWGADNDSMLMAVFPLAADRRFRNAARPEVFTSVLRTVPTYAAWLDVLEPISNVAAMGGLHNTLRRLVVDGEPVATGLHAVGDTVCTTNPTLGRGLSCAMRGAADLADTLREHPDDPLAQALAMDGAVEAHIAPFYADQAAVDGARLAQLRRAVFGQPAADQPAPARDRVSYAELRSAALFDPVAFRAFWTVMGMLRVPEEVYRDQQVVAQVREVIAREGAANPVAQPTAEQLAAALSTPATAR